MFELTRDLSFCYGHRLLNYDGKCRHLHGHNGRAQVRLVAESLDARGMLVDFSDIRRLLGDWIDAELDHRMLLHRDDPALPHLRRLNEPVYVMDENPTAENIARLIFRKARELGLPVAEVRLWETDTASAVYREA
jgi:6-pyruvoyltetrahydropterin/6-carboxytetrahydropterin synthase